MVMARCRSPSEDSIGSTESDSGMMKAVPSPRTARAAISTPPRAGAGAGQRGGPEHQQGGQQQPLAAEAVAEQAAGSSIAASTRL
jgi:hypothetical protein